MSKFYYIQAKIPPHLSDELDHMAMSQFNCSGVEEFSIDEPKVDEILGDRSYSGGDVPESVIYEVEEVLTNEGVLKKYYFEDELDSVEFNKYLTEQKIPSSCESDEIKDWNEEWKKGYTPILVSSELEIIPEWEKEGYQSRATNQVYIYPGMGFGTGSHETTFLCLKLLMSLNYKSFTTCLDFGCGSGILGLALEILRPNEVEIDLYDIDSQALDNCRQNIDLNQIENDQIKLLLPKDREQIQRKYDLVFANILQNVLLTEGEYLVSSIKDKGSLILSGLLSGQEVEVIENYQKLNPRLKLVEVIKKGDWVAVLMECS